MRMFTTSMLLIAISGGAGLLHAGETITYTYDAKGRVIKSVRTGTANNGVQETYVYDKANNRTSKVVSGSSLPPP